MNKLRPVTLAALFAMALIGSTLTGCISVRREAADTTTTTTTTTRPSVLAPTTTTVERTTY